MSSQAPVIYTARNSILARLSAFTLAFLLVVSPVLPAFAQESTEATQTQEQSIESTNTETLQEESSEIINESSNSEEIQDLGGEEESMMMSMSTSGGFLGDTRDLPNLGLPQIDEGTGGFVYKYPLTVAPGRNGLHPDLMLEYSSQDNDQAALFGYGWSINIPYIKRLNKTGINNLYTDNYFYSSLSGELVLVSGTTYAPKVEDGNFLSYTYDGTYWTVKDKSGTVYKFGDAAGSRQDNPSDSSEVYKWMLSETRDTNNNYIKYEYYKNTGQIYPDTITYTGNNTTDGIFTVVFTRSSRSDAITQNPGAFDVTTSYKITDIQAKISGTWVRKYVLAYTTGDNSQRSLLSSITESGQDESSNVVTLPAVEFTYQVATTSATAFASDSAWSTAVSSTINTNTAYGAIVADVNGDGLPDIMESHDDGSTWNKGTYLNDGDGSWTQDTNLTPPIAFSSGSSAVEQSIRAADLNADGLVDFVQSGNNGGGNVEKVYINQGTSWYLDANWDPKCEFVSATSGDIGCRLVDINGDDLPDFIKAIGDSNGDAPITTNVYLNNGSNWTFDTGWSIPVDLRWGVIPIDYNGDGLLDFLKGYKNDLNNPTTSTLEAYKNNGDKTWSLDSSYTPPVYFSVATSGSTLPVTTGVRFADINGDGLVDILKGSDTTNGAYLNKGPGWQFTTYWSFPSGSSAVTSDDPVRMGDFDGDGMVDKYESVSGSTSLLKNQKLKSDLISTAKNAYGAVTSITYKGTPKYTNGGALLNPNLPFVLMTVYQTSTDPGFGSGTITNTYSYEGGDYYYNTVLDRKYAGFGKVVLTDANGKKTNYYHQGNSTNSSQGEYDDHVSKIGRLYRTEISDSSGNIYKKTVNKWDKYNQATGRDYIKLTRSTELTYDGDIDHKDKSEEYSYDNTYGNLTTKTMWGVVSASDDGSFTDTGTDRYVETISYTANTTDYIVGLPYQDTVVDQSSNKVNEVKTYYDTQSLGTVTDGNTTKVEKWKTGSTYVNTQQAYNTTYGIVSSSTDERGKTTTYSYDSYNLYPASVTNPLSQVTSYTYDYSLGKPKQVTDPNSFVYQTTYDGLDRVKEQKIPDLDSPYSPVLKTAYTYTDTSGAVSVQKTNYLDSTNTSLEYSYYDKLNRIIQDRTEAETDYSVRDYLYNSAGLLQKESVPYSSSGTSRTSATSTTNLYNNYTYDAMGRVLTISNNIGTTTNAYDDWKTTVTDPRNKIKYYYNDAYGNLVQVDEVNGASTYSTYYEWNGNKKLIKITDALSNIRNFTYDGLGRRLTAEDLHASADGTYGSWTYTYDDAGNLTQSVDPKSQTINYTYNDINQVLTEDYTGVTGTEVTYTYGGCTNGTGKLCSVATLQGIDTDYIYNSNGGVASEAKDIDSTTYTTSYTYDRQGNILEITNPDSSKVKYAFNTAGQLETIQRKESTDSSYIDVVLDLDYGPHGKVTNQEDENGVVETNTYDATKLYRLSRKQASIETSSQSSVNIYAGTGDGYVRSINDNWDTAHDATTGSDYSYSGNYDRSGSDYASGSFAIWRTFIPFDTSSLDDSVSITDVKLHVYNALAEDSDNDGNDFITVVQTSQASTSSLSEEDFDQSGNTEGIDSGQRKDLTSMSTGYITFTLNSTGRGWVSPTGWTKLGLREGHDILDVAVDSPSSPNQATKLNYRSANNTGTTYDPYLEITYVSSGSSYIQDLSFTYDNNGNITQIVDASNTDTSKTVDYGYDDLNRLTSAAATNVASGQSTYSHTFTYNAIGNLTNKSDVGDYTYAGTSYANPHAATSINSVTQTYDNNGNLTDDTVWTHTWDHKNRLVESDDGTDTLTYAYDHNGSRAKFVNSTETVITPTQYYGKEGSTDVKHIYAKDRLVATIRGTGASADIYYIHTDHLGGSEKLTDDTGAIQKTSDYFAYGAPRISQGSLTDSKGYIGKDYDGDTGLSYLNARYYEGNTGRFISQDPSFLALGDQALTKSMTGMTLEQVLMDPQLLNSYSYARNNPIRYTDPTGRFIDVPFISNSPWVQQGASALYDQSAVWRTAMDNPIAAGAVVGVAAGAAAYGAAAGITALSVEYLGGAGTACIAGCQKAAQTLQSTPQALGKIGEQISGLTKNTERIPSATNTANYRIPDGLNHATKTLSEVKNVNYQSFTNQLKDSLIHAQNTGYKFELFTRPSTTISGPLQNAINSGSIIHKFLGK